MIQKDIEQTYVWRIRISLHKGRRRHRPTDRRVLQRARGAVRVSSGSQHPESKYHHAPRVSSRAMRRQYMMQEKR